MNLKMLKAALTGLLLAISGFANATLIDHGSYTTDTVSGLEWLDWTEASAVTQTDALASFGSGGWRIASQIEVYGLLNNYFGTTFSSGGLTFYASSTLVDFTARLGEFMSLFGTNNGTQVFGRIEGFGLIGVQSSHVFAGYGVSSYGQVGITNTREGVVLVRQVMQVPEPSTLAIFALGMIGLASRRFKKQS